MPKRLSRKRLDEIKAEIEAKAAGTIPPTPDPELVVKTLSCGHAEMVHPMLDPARAICHQCKIKAMCFNADAAPPPEPGA